MTEALELSPKVAGFYHGQSLPVHFIENIQGKVGSGELLVPYPTEWDSITDNNIIDKLEEINETHEVITSDDGKYVFAIAVVNRRADGPTRIVNATGRSTIRRNANNAYELALQALTEKDHRIVYIGSGIGGFGSEIPMSEYERKRLARTGSMIVTESGGCQPLPVVETLAALLRKRGIQPQEASSDSAGAVLSSALCVVFGGIHKVYHNARLGVVDIHPSIELVKRYVLEGRFGSQHAHNSPDRLKVGDESKQLVLTHMPDVYGVVNPQEQKGLESISQILPSARALACGPAAGDPLLRDALAVIGYNPGVAISYVAPEHDTISGSFSASRERWGAIAGLLSAAGAMAVRVYQLEWASHNWRGYYPAVARSLERRVFQ